MTECLSLKKSNCKNCYKCIRHCPVKSIRFSGNQAHIVPEDCILCGQCFVVCPQGAKQIGDETEKVRVLIQSGDPVYVSLAPSFVANYNGLTIEAMRGALRKLGFAGVEETGVGATFVKREYERILREEHRDILLTSCCHAVNLLIEKHFPEALPYLADVLSPMQAHCRDIKERVSGAKTVFIGPCVAKKDEAATCGDLVDAVLTFEQLSRWLEAEHIALPESPADGAPEKRENTGRARSFPTTGGVLRSLTEKLDDYTYLAVDGTENCIAVLRDVISGKVHHCMIELSACYGSCVGGPVMEKYHRKPVEEYIAVSRYTGEEDFPVEQPFPSALRKPMTDLYRSETLPTEEELKQILLKMGKSRPEDELNCGSCGYDTCREKAIAVFRGKADPSMCMPYLTRRAESFSDNILNNSPDGILVINGDLEVQQINLAARKILNLRSASDVLGEPVNRILDPKDFVQVENTGRGIFDRRTYLAEYGRYVVMTITRSRDDHTLLCTLRDVTDEQEAREKKENLRRQTVETADRVVEKQMRIVQEIASLLGETAAETKIALTKLKESTNDDE